MDTLFGWTVDCSTDTSIVLNPGPSASFTSAINNLDVAFTDQSLGSPASYTWDFGDGNGSTMPSPNHTYATAGTYVVCLTVSSGTCVDVFCDSVTVAPCTLPTPAFSSTSSNTTVTFSDQSVSTSTITGWLWDFGDGNTSTMQNPMHTYAADGVYTVCLTVTDACGNDSTCSSVSVVTISAAEGLGFTMSVFPNPAQDLLNVNLELAQSEDVTLRVFDLRGALLQESHYDMLSQGRLEVATDQLADGTYLIEVQAGVLRETRRFSIVH